MIVRPFVLARHVLLLLGFLALGLAAAAAAMALVEGMEWPAGAVRMVILNEAAAILKVGTFSTFTGCLRLL